jgi:aerobic-type carbon monoxide dehydrogenase small subunit (CoxS/CutS family)
MALKINVNGVDRGADVDLDMPLLWMLRGGRR